MSVAEPTSTISVRRAPRCWTRSRAGYAHPRSTGIAHAQTVDRSAYTQKVKQDSGSERLLRYPDGRVRCIRYPLISTEAEAQSDQIDVTVSYEEDWQPDRWDDIDWAWDVTSSWEGPSSSSAGAAAPAATSVNKGSPLPKVTVIVFLGWCSSNSQV